MLEVRIVAQVPSQEHSIPRTWPEKKIRDTKMENINLRDKNSEEARHNL